MDLSTSKAMRFSSVITGFPVKSYHAKDSAKLLMITPFTGVIDSNWNHKIVRKYTFIRLFLSRIPFIFLRSLFNLVSKSSGSPSIIYRQINNLIFGKDGIKSAEHKFLRYFLSVSHLLKSYNPAYLFENRNRNLERFSLLQPFEKLVPLVMRSETQGDIRSAIFNKFNIFITGLFDQNQKIVGGQTQNQELTKRAVKDESPILRSNQLLQNLKCNRKMFSRSLSITKIKSSDYSSPQPTVGDLSEAKNLLGEPIGLETKESSTLSYKPSQMKNKTIAIRSSFESMVHTTHSQRFTHVPIYLIEKTMVSPHLEFPQPKHFPGKQKEKNLGFSGYGYNGIELTHSRPANIASAPLLKEETPQFAPFEEIGNKKLKGESEIFHNEIRQALFDSPVIHKVADQVSSILERRLFIERERRGL